MASMRFAIIVLVLVGTSVTADSEIHRCLMEDGTMAFQEMPCSEPVAKVDDSGEADERRDNSAIPPEPTLPEQASKDRAECEKTTRDAIDAIDLELRTKAYSKEQGREFLAELLELTQQLRACKQL